MRALTAALAAAILMACAAEKTAPADPLTVERIERAAEHTVAVAKPMRAAEGHEFVIVHLIEDPAREENREWLGSFLEAAGQKYPARFSSVNKSESGTAPPFRSNPTIRTVHPDRIRIVFEVPAGVPLRRVIVPHSIALPAAQEARAGDR